MDAKKLHRRVDDEFVWDDVTSQDILPAKRLLWVASGLSSRGKFAQKQTLMNGRQQIFLVI
jgi:hypothetical protein